MQVKKQYIKDAILNYAESEFYKLGYQKTSMRKIARENKISIGNLYNYFISKEDLYLAVFYKDAEKRIDFIYKKMKKGKTGLDKLYIYGDAYYQYASKNPKAFEFEMHWQKNGLDMKKISKDLLEEVSKSRSKNIDYFDNAIIEGQEDGSIKKELKKNQLGKFMALTIRLMLDEVLNLKYEEKEFYYNYLDFFLQGIKANK